jgi:hypothetical protein
MLPLSSSKVTVRALWCVRAHRAYGSSLDRAQASPVLIGQSRLSLHRSGMRKLTVGSRAKSDGMA